MFRGTQCLESAKHLELSIGSLRNAVSVLGPGEIVADNEANQPDLVNHVKDLLPKFGAREEVDPSPLLVKEEDLCLLDVNFHKVPVGIVRHFTKFCVSEVGLV